MLASLLARTRTIWPLPVLALLFICVILGWRLAVTSGDGQLHLTFLDVGSADAILLQTPKGRSVLIGGGPSTSMLSDALGRRLPFIRRKLDWLVVAATGEQQVAALPRILDRYPPDQVLWSGNLQASFSARQTDAWLADQGVPITRAGVGQKLDLGEGVLLEVHSVGPRGSVLVLDWQNFRAVLPIGVDTETMSSLQFGADLGPADVLLLADSGFAPSNPPAWIENLHPTLVVLSVAAGDIEGRPDQATLDSLSGFSLLRTDRNGWISVVTNGEEMRVQAERRAAPAPVDDELHGD
jgi:competence protein ComEC